MDWNNIILGNTIQSWLVINLHEMWETMNILWFIQVCMDPIREQMYFMVMGFERMKDQVEICKTYVIDASISCVTIVKDMLLR